jgi:hypothetical protein
LLENLHSFLGRSNHGLVDVAMIVVSTVDMKAEGIFSSSSRPTVEAAKLTTKSTFCRVRTWYTPPY